MQTFRGRARRLDDIDLPRLGHRIGVGEDEIHAVLEVESRGSGFDKQGRPAMLFEPHLFWRELGPGPKRDRAVREGLAYARWKPGAYPADSYPRLIEAMSIDETAALRSASWGLGQILGSNHAMAGYATPQAMVRAFLDDEDAHLEAMVNFIKAAKLDDELRRHDWAGFARGYNGPSYAKHGYHKRLAAAFAKWKGIRDTPWSPADSIAETKANDPAPVVFEAPAPLPVPANDAGKKVSPPAPAPNPVAPAPAPLSFWQRFLNAFRRTA